MEYSSLGQALRSWRDRKGLTQVDAAKAIDMSQPLLSRIENNERDLEFGELARFAKLYGASDKEVTAATKIATVAARQQAAG